MENQVLRTALTNGIFFCTLQSVSLCAEEASKNFSQPPYFSKSTSERESSGPLFMGELLIWKAQENGLEYALQITDLPTNAEIGKGKIKSIGETDWNLGFRIGAGYQFQYDRWSVNAEWTRFHPGANTSHANTDNKVLKPISVLYPQQGGLSSGFGPSSVSSKWHLRYDTLDLLVSRSFSVRSFLFLNPKFGPTAAWIRQDYNLAADVHQVQANVDFFVKIKTSNDFSGIGLKAGLDSMWLFGPHLRLYGDLMGALLYGHYHMHQKGSGNYPSAPIIFFPTNSSPNIHVTDSFRTVRAALDLKLGLAWRWGFDHGKRECLLYCGWEEVLWVNLNQFSSFTSFSMNKHSLHGELGMTGFDVGLKFKL